jgi:hypothetical protein
MVSVIMGHPEFVQDGRYMAIFSEFFQMTFRSQLMTPGQVMHTVLTSKKRNRPRTEQELFIVAQLLKLFAEIIGNEPQNWAVNSLLTEPIVEGFRQTFPNDSEPFTEFLLLLRRLEPPLITRELLTKAFAPYTNSGSVYLAALFSLLPDALHSPDFVDVFDFFKANVDRTTVSFWTLWLKLRAYYVPGFPVTVATPDKEALSGYRGLLISAFSSLLFRATPGDERTMTHFQCWSMICETPGIASTIADNLIDDLRLARLSIYPLLIDFLHPALLTIPDRVFEAIVDGFCRYHFDEAQFESFAKLSASIFAVYIFRFSTDEVHIPTIAAKLLEWIPKLAEMHSCFLEAVLDIFNFVICFTASERDTDPLQGRLHDRIKDRLKMVPREIQNLVILNHPRQVFRPTVDPLYLDYTGPDREPAFSLGPTFSPDRGDGPAFETVSLFTSFDEEFNQPWYWGR